MFDMALNKIIFSPAKVTLMVKRYKDFYLLSKKRNSKKLVIAWRPGILLFYLS